MSRRNEQMKLGVFFYETGNHIAAWRHPKGHADAALNFAHYCDIARTAERGKLDLIFIQDELASKSTDLVGLSHTSRSLLYDPLTLLPALAAVTKHIGLVATATTTYNEPFHIARKFATLDHISAGRSGWNVVTSASANEHLNFSRDTHAAAGDRYERATEFVEVVLGLWDTWEDDAFPMNKDTGQFFDPAKLHVLNHKGNHFSVRGPLSVARSPQGRPVIVLAGSSEDGKELAAKVADVVFALHPTMAEGQAFYADVKNRLIRYSRSPESIKILPGAFVISGRSEQEAKDKFEELQALVDPVVGLSTLAQVADLDLRKYPVDGPVPAELLSTEGATTRRKMVIEVAQREKLTIRQLYMRISGARGHWLVMGTPKRIVDQLEERFVNYAADGFNILPPFFPGSLNDFVDLVVPELQRRGLFRKEYNGTTLRESLGVPKPPHHIHVKT
jgi:FMN-dependent oxidoreductase (nitrilotriacetate monooxygenase family)